VSDPLTPAVLDQFRRLDTCAVSNAVETLAIRLRNEGFTDRRVRCLFEDLPPAVGYAVTATIRCSAPPPVGHTYADRTDWWNAILNTPAPRIVVVQDVDDQPGLGAFVGEVHANILRALDCVAYLTNGTVRDLPAVREIGLLTFAAGTTPSHAFVHIVGFGAPVEVGGLTVTPGDLLVADRHGVVSVPPEIATRIPRIVAEMRVRERQVIEYCRGRDFSVEKLRELVADFE
jgi:4-hydroxy-4-methyl-2-oxoglutarate aldolase